MISLLIEPAFILLFTACGILTLLRGGLAASLWVVPLGFVAGLCEYIVIAYFQSSLFATSSPILAISFMVILTLWLTKSVHENLLLPNSKQALNIGFGLLLIFLAIVLFEKLNLFKFHYDSYTYLITGRYIVDNNLEELSQLFAAKRFGTVSLIHAVAEINDRLYLRSITPLTTIAGITGLWYIAQKAFKKHFRSAKTKQLLATVLVLGTLVLLTNHSFLFHSLYINGHMFFAVLFLYSVGLGWLDATGKLSGEERLAHAVLQILATVALVFTRPEGGILALLAITPLVLSNKISRWHQRYLLGGLGAAILLERFFILQNKWLKSGIEIEEVLKPKNFVFILIGGSLVFLAVFFQKLPVKYFYKQSKKLLLLTEAGLWLGILAYYLRGEEATAAINRSLHSFYFNFVVGEGGWGLLIIALLFLGVISLAVKNIPGKTLFRYPLTTFLPASLFFAIFRGGGYRVGTGDSFNRAVMHVLFVATLFIIVVTFSGLSRSKYRQK